MNTSRRSFMASSATLAAGAALGISPRKSSRTYGPVKLYTHFIFFKEPIEIASELFVDEANDLFGIRCFDEKGIRRAVIQTSFLNLKAVLRDGQGVQRNTLKNRLCITKHDSTPAYLSPKAAQS